MAFKARASLEVANGILTRAERTANKVASKVLRQTAAQARQEGMRQIVSTKYSTMKQVDIKPNTKITYDAGPRIMSGNQVARTHFFGKAIPLTFFKPTEKPVRWHPKWGWLWQTTITVFNKTKKLDEAFHTKGSNPIHRGGWGKSPGTFDKTSKLFKRRDYDSAASLPIERFKFFSIPGLMRALWIDERVQDWGNKQIAGNFIREWNRENRRAERAKIHASLRRKS